MITSDPLAPSPTQVGPAPEAVESEVATSAEIALPAAREDAALAPTAERTSPAVRSPESTQDTELAGDLDAEQRTGLRLDIGARLVERARALAPNLPPTVLRVQPVRETPEEAVLRAALRIGLAALAALDDSDEDP